jgi:hypothetical protein
MMSPVMAVSPTLPSSHEKAFGQALQGAGADAENHFYKSKFETSICHIPRYSGL